jgi:hypothetical protein
MKNKKGFEFSFGWLFAIIVGSVIIFLAVYASVKLVGTERKAQDTASAKELEIILTPVETGFETAKAVAPIRFPSETRIYNNCSARGNFGEQEISIASSLGLGKKWQAPGTPVLFYNKYIFSSSIAEGKEFYVFSKPFKMPYKIADPLFMISNKEKYCFVNAPNDIYDEVNKLGLKGIYLNESVTDCIRGSKKVCFYSDWAGNNNCSAETYDIVINNWLTTAGDPKFTNPDMSNILSQSLFPLVHGYAANSIPDLRLQSTSQCINAGTHLTQANGSGSSSTTLIVDDALYFQDGSWGSVLSHGVTVFPDWIAVGTVTNVVEIKSINYSTKRITLASSKTWADNAPVWLYKKSDGERVLYGSAPDIGAHEYFSSITIQDIDGDVNGDDKVDIADLSAVAINFGRRTGDAGFNPSHDVVVNGIIDITDLSFVAIRFTG